MIISFFDLIKSFSDLPGLLWRELGSILSILALDIIIRILDMDKAFSNLLLFLLRTSMIKESFDEIKSVYGQEKMAPRKGRASMKIPSYAKGKFDHIQSNLAHENISEDSKDHG
jgi:hypothetical protein